MDWSRIPGILPLSFVLICVLVGLGILAVPVWADGMDQPAGAGATPPADTAGASSVLANVPLFFTPNAGQADPAVLFTCRATGYTVLFAKDRVAYSLPSGDGGRYNLVQQFSGSNPDPAVSGLDPLDTRVSFFTGPESSWHTGITPFGAVVYGDLYPGTDLVYRGMNGSIKREFLVRPEGDPTSIRIIYDTAQQVGVTNDGSLVVRAGAGELRESPPVCYQDGTGGRVDVPCRFEIRDDGTVSFVTGPYDRALPLMIDPALAYCGYIGGSSTEVPYGAAVDNQGSLYIAGYVLSTEETFPVTVGPDLTQNDGMDVFVAKVNSAGTGLQYCGYIGGSGSDDARAIAVDSSGCAYVTGGTSSTESTGFPVTVGPDLTYNGGAYDVFVAKVNSDGTALDYCGYIGGSGSGSYPEYGQGIAVENQVAFVTGYTNSTEGMGFPVTVGPDLFYNGDTKDAFVARVNSSGSQLDYCGYIGGSGYDQGNAIAVTGGNAYVTGYTGSSEATFPANVGPDVGYNNGTDVFVAKVNNVGSALTYCGYIGGSGYESGNGIAVDSIGNAYVTGDVESTEGTGFPVTVGPDVSFNGYSDAFVAKVIPAGTGLAYCGYIGGDGLDSANGIAIDANGNAYVAGRTYSNESGGFPVSGGPDLTQNGDQDAFVAKVNSLGTSLAYCGYIGGSASDDAKGIAVITGEDSPYVTHGDAYVAGVTASTQASFPVVRGPDLTHNGGSIDAFVAKVVISPLVNAIKPKTGGRGTTVTVKKLAGKNFAAGAKVYLTKGSARITGKSVKVVTPAKIQCKFKIPASAATGKWTVNVTNADGLSGTKAKAFMVTG